jgi:hypothetical protein
MQTVEALKKFGVDIMFLLASLNSLDDSYSTHPLLREIIDSLPNDVTQINDSVKKLQEVTKVWELGQDQFQSQKIVLAGVRRGQKRLVSDSDDDKDVQPDPSQSKTTLTKKISRRSKRSKDDELLADNPNFNEMTQDELTAYCKNEYLTSSWRDDKSRAHTKLQLVDALLKIKVHPDECEKLVYPERFEDKGLRESNF